MGTEPALQGSRWIYSKSNLARAFHYYNYHFRAKDIRSWVSKYMKDRNYSEEQIKAFESIDPDYVPTWLCAIAKMKLGGVEFPEEWTDKFHNRLQDIINDSINLSRKPEKSNIVIFPKEIQSIVIVDGLLDDFYRSEYRGQFPGLYDTLKEKNIRTTEASLAADHYSGLLQEVQSETEGYEYLTPRLKKNYVSFLSQVIEDLRLYASNLRKTTKVRKPRAKKVKSAEQLTSKVRFLIEDPELKIISSKPADIVGSSAVWLWNPKNRKLTYLQAADKLSVKGSTILGLDEKTCRSKKIRKPAILHSMLNSSKVVMIKEFDKIRTKPGSVPARLNKDTLILRVIK